MNSDQPKPAPTAEEQLPLLVIDGRTYNPDDFNAADLDVSDVLDCRERQLLAALAERDAALRSNREKDAQLAELKADLSQYAFIADAASSDLVSDRIHVIPKLKARLAEKDAKIAELESRLATWEPRESAEIGGSV